MDAPLDPAAAGADPKAAAVTAFWADFCRGAALPATTPYQTWYFGDSQPMSVALLDLVLDGPKRATAGLAASFNEGDDDVPQEHVYSVVTDKDGAPRAVLYTTSVERRPLNQVDAQFAWDEGEGDRTLADWMAGHVRYFTRECGRLGIAFRDTLPVLLERFELVYPFERALASREPRILPLLVPGALSTAVQMQAAYYTREHGFNHQFEAGRLADVGAFLARYDPARDGVWLLVQGGAVHGTLVIDASGVPQRLPQLRWFMLDDALRGGGWGRRLLAQGLQFCRDRGYGGAWLDTFGALDAARHLYQQAGFRLTHEATDTTWGPAIAKQTWEWRA